MRIFVILSFCVLFMAQQCVGDKLKIEVLYESLCPDSVRFIANQLTPAYKDIAEYVNISFVPFGKSFSHNNNFECQHGARECQGNRVQSCVLSILPDQGKRIEYVDCFMQAYWKNPEEFGQKCAEQVGIHWELVKQCFTSMTETKLQLQAEAVTNKYKPKFVPTVVFDQTFDQKAQDASMYSFRQYVCERLQKNNPNACSVIKLKPIHDKV